MLVQDAFKMTGKHSIKASYIDEIPIEEGPAKNGFIISYDEISKPKTSNKEVYSNSMYKSCKEVFDADDAEDLDKAFKRFRELAMMQYNAMNEKD
jgi:hypothetical protein